MIYPKTKKTELIENNFGLMIEDPYRWLEEDQSEETKIWLKEQQDFTESFLNQYPDRSNILNHLKKLNNYERKGVPLKRGNWYYFSKNSGLQNQYIYYRQKSLESEPELFFDPNTLSDDGTTTAFIISRSNDDKYIAFKISKAGADASEIWVMDTDKKEFLNDKITNLSHSGASWYKNGFFYSRNDSKPEQKAQYKNQKVYYHKLGESEIQDTLIFQDEENPLRYNRANVSDDEKYLFIYSFKGTNGAQILYKSLDDPNDEFKCLFQGFDFNGWLVNGYDDGIFYLFTNKNASNYCLYQIDLSSPQEENWKLIIPERDYLLDSATIINNKIIAIFTKDVFSKIEILELNGQLIKEIKMPFLGSASFIRSKKEDTEGFFAFDSYVSPSQIFHYDMLTHEMKFFYTYPIDLDFNQYCSEQVFFKSKDGTMIPMTLNYKKDMKKDGNRPVYLTGYGGFNDVKMPIFNIERTILMDKGGIFVIVNLRGGGEYGEKWHEAGMLLNKQNVFDDFISATEYMINEGYTNPDKTVIAGGSNGGLLVGACMTQRPELFKIALPMMGVLDMLRFHKFTCGWGWMAEYGNPEEEIHFKNLLKYSPVHNIKEGVKYPITMVVTADHDDRVIPGHSFKFAAQLQEKGSSENPYLLYVQSNSSHGSSNFNKFLQISADKWSFIFKYLNI